MYTPHTICRHSILMTFVLALQCTVLQRAEASWLSNILQGKPPITSSPGGSLSQTAVVTPPSIHEDGVVYSGSGAGGEMGVPVARATLQHDPSGAAYWVSNYSNIYGSPQPRRAVQFDRRDVGIAQGNSSGNGGPSGANSLNLANGFRTGMIRFVNNYAGHVVIAVYHPDLPGRVYRIVQLPENRAEVLHSGNQPVIAGSDWRLQIIFGNGVRSDPKPLSQVAMHVNGQWTVNASDIYTR